MFSIYLYDINREAPDTGNTYQTNNQYEQTKNSDAVDWIMKQNKESIATDPDKANIILKNRYFSFFIYKRKLSL